MKTHFLWAALVLIAVSSMHLARGLEPPLLSSPLLPS